jgi:hypothetical protein
VVAVSRDEAVGERADERAVDPTPARASAALTVAMAALSVAVAPGPIGTVVGVPGAGLVAVGATRGSRRAIDYGKSRRKPRASARG